MFRFKTVNKTDKDNIIAKNIVIDRRHAPKFYDGIQYFIFIVVKIQSHII